MLPVSSGDYMRQSSDPRGQRFIVKQHSPRGFRDALAFRMLAFFLAVVFLTGGGARADIQSLVILRPVAAVIIGFGIWNITWNHVHAFRLLFLFMGAGVALVAIHLVPLPASIWIALPGRELAAEVDRVAGFGAIWRPISLVPTATWNALYSLMVPAATLLLLVQLTREQRFKLLPILIVFGLFSGFLGLLQAIGPTGGPLYFYRITNDGSAVGLFANRNHQAVLLACLFPMLAVYASTGLKSIEQARFRMALAAGAGMALVPLILVTGSRAGLICGLIGLCFVPWLYRHPQFNKPAKRKMRKIAPRYVAIGAAVLGLGVLTIVTSRAEALARLIATNPMQEVRLAYWLPLLPLIIKYFPVGSGIGSFVEVFRVDEPLSLLETSYANHAHNDLLELLLTGGLPAALLIGFAVVAWIRGGVLLIRQRAAGGRDNTFGILGAVVIFILAFGSIVDYPLRVPSLAVLLVIGAVWMVSGTLQAATRDGAVSKVDRKI